MRRRSGPAAPAASRLLLGLLFLTLAGPAADAAPARPSAGPSAAAPFIVALDPGHGGRDPGSRGVGGLLEKDFTLRVARLLAGRLAGYPEIKVVLTREGDAEITPVQRAAVANFNGASLFLSIQADASWRPGARGASILVAAPQRPPRVAGEPPEAVALRWQRGQNVHLAESLRFAQGLQRRLAAAAGGSKPPLRALPLRALEGARMPAAYVSLGVISSPEEEARLREMGPESPPLAALAGEVLAFAGVAERPAAEAPPAGGETGGTPGEKPAPEAGSPPPAGREN